MSNDTIKICEVLKSTPGVSASKIAVEIWPCVPDGILQDLEKRVTSILQELEQFNVVVYDSGWRLSQHDDPFKHLLQASVDEVALSSALCSLSLIYFGSGERRLAAAIATFVADPSKDLERRRQVYICLLVLCIPLPAWPKRAKDIVIPDDIDWNLLESLTE
jgi:hypothetical protein